MANSKAYRHKGSGIVIAVAEDSSLEEVVTGSGEYEVAELDDLATDVPAFTAARASAAERQESNGWLTPTGVAPVAVSGATTATATGAEDPLAKVLSGTTEEVNTFLDEHKEDGDLVAAVLAAEGAETGKRRKGILEGRHKPAVADPATQPASE